MGTIPEAGFPLTLAPCSLERDGLRVGDRVLPVNRGTPALLAAASLAGACLRSSSGTAVSDPMPGPPEASAAPSGPADPFWALVAGDTGKGEGSRQVYKELAERLPDIAPRGVTFHYLLPDVDWHNRILMVLDELPKRPLLAADAGYMYAAKMSGYASAYDLFTPDIGELAFLADPDAPHPFYTRNFLLADEGKADELIAAACAHGNAARNLLVKGQTDRFVRNGRIVRRVSRPDVPMLEPVGGTGDTLTGLATALLAAGLPMEQACVRAMAANRLMGELARPTPASSIADILARLPAALEHVMRSSGAPD